MSIKVKSIKVRSDSEEKSACYFCNGTKKVKYNAVIEENGTEKIVPCCKMCEHKYAE